MKSIQAEYNEASKAINIKKDAKTEDWVSVCRRLCATKAGTAAISSAAMLHKR